MRRASASNHLHRTTASLRFQPGTFVRAGITSLIALALTVSVSFPSFAAENPEENELGKLKLNSDVLVNESVGAGSTGDFAIRGKLFSVELSTRAQELADAAGERLAVAGSLDFRSPAGTAGEYDALRADLFDGYTVQVIPRHADMREASPMWYSLLLFAGIPVVLLGGVLAGRIWSRRKRVAA